ncbi:MAG TPA: 1-acyl-sn-glycerol-3-phosphate acyltransferase, partial [Solirubrobacterales bacterium]
GDDPVAQAIAAVARAAAPAGGQTLAELGVDSLGLVEVALALEEKTGKQVADGDLRVDMTVDEVRAFVAALPEGPGDVAGERQQAPREREEAEGEARLWPYTWGRAFRILGAPFDLLYRLYVSRTIVLGAEHLAGLPPRVIVAGTHRSYPDVYLVRHALAATPARRMARRLVVPAAAVRLAGAGALAGFAKLAFGLYSLDQHGEHSGRGPSLRGLARLAEAGNPILIFPQGKQIPPEMEISGDPDARFRSGVGHLAEALGAVVVPFGQAGTERLIPPNPPPGYRGLVVAGIPVALRRGPLAIAFGEPIRLEPGDSPRAFAERLERICFALSRQAEAELSRRP